MPEACTLLIDAGNSRVKWAWSQDLRQPLDDVHVSPGRGWLEALAETAGKHETGAIWLADVVGLGEIDIRRLQAVCQCRPRQVRVSQDCLNLVVAYPNPGNLGVDRWLAMLAAWQPKRSPCVVVDAGSAITVDLITGQGRHLGGWIAPGFRGLAAGLAQVAPRLPELAMTTGEPVPGNDTQAAMANGRAAMIVGLISHGIDHLAVEIDRPAVDIDLILTGGDSARLAKLLSHHHRLVQEPHLVLEGLRLLIQHGLD